MTNFSKLEKQALCPHAHREKEVILGQKTGDTICHECDEIFMPNEVIVSPEFRSLMVISVHALMIAMHVNIKLKLVKNFKTKFNVVYDWALVDEAGDFCLPVHSEVANKAILAGQVVL